MLHRTRRSPSGLRSPPCKNFLLLSRHLPLKYAGGRISKPLPTFLHPSGTTRVGLIWLLYPKSSISTVNSFVILPTMSTPSQSSETASGIVYTQTLSKPGESTRGCTPNSTCSSRDMSSSRRIISLLNHPVTTRITRPFAGRSLSVTAV